MAGALTGDANAAVAYNGTNEYVQVPYTAALNPSSFTVEGWAYVSGGQGTFCSLVTSRDYAPGNARGYVLYAGNDNNWQLWTGNGAWNVLEGPAVTLNQWGHHWSPPTVAGATMRLYVNGILAGSQAAGYLQSAPCARCAPPRATPTGQQTTSCPGTWTRRPCTQARCRRRGCRRTTRQALADARATA